MFIHPKMEPQVPHGHLSPCCLHEDTERSVKRKGPRIFSREPDPAAVSVLNIALAASSSEENQGPGARGVSLEVPC